MKIGNMHKFYVYKRVPKKTDGESLIEWHYKDSYYLNDQQDIDELDKNVSGIVDFDTLKLRIRKDVNIEKTDGISSIELSVDKNNVVINDEKPQYTVETTSIIGRSHLITCKTYNGE